VTEVGLLYVSALCTLQQRVLGQKPEALTPIGPALDVIKS
jgi:hypothetical protein